MLCFAVSGGGCHFLEGRNGISWGGVAYVFCFVFCLFFKYFFWPFSSHPQIVNCMVRLSCAELLPAEAVITWKDAMGFPGEELRMLFDLNLFLSFFFSIVVRFFFSFRCESLNSSF